ncbi:MAG TPA: MFS transporter [Bacteroidales bacterium]
MSTKQQVAEKIGQYRWTIATLLLFSTTFNYLDRQVISYLKPYFCSAEGFAWTNTQFSILTSFFTGFYGLMTIVAGFVIDKIGTKLGLALSLIVWSIFGVANAFVGSVLWLHVVVRSLFGVGEAGNFPASIKTVAEWFPKKERALATSIFNSGSNLGAMIAALFVPWCMVFFGDQTGWKMALIFTGAVGFIWLIFWFWLYDSPSKSKRLDKAEYDYIHSDEAVVAKDANGDANGVSYGNLASFKGRATKPTFWGTFIIINIIGLFLIQVMNMMVDKTQPFGTAPKIFLVIVGLLYAWFILALQSRRLHDIGKSSKYLFFNLIPIIGTLYVLIFAGFKTGSKDANEHGEAPKPSILAYNQTWAFFVGKFFTDGIWWFYLFWLPDYLINQFGMTLSEVKWPTFIVYFISIIGSVFGGSLPLMLINRGMQVYKARMTAMIIIAFVPLVVLTTQYFGNVSIFGSAAMYLAVSIISIAAAAHQAWSANLFTTVSDMFPKKAVGSVTGIGAMAGGLGGVLVLMLVGVLRDAFISKPQTAYLIMFIVCGGSYLIAWAIMKLLVPKHKPITL